MITLDPSFNLTLDQIWHKFFWDAANSSSEWYSGREANPSHHACQWSRGVVIHCRFILHPSITLHGWSKVLTCSWEADMAQSILLSGGIGCFLNCFPVVLWALWEIWMSTVWLSGFSALIQSDSMCLSVSAIGFLQKSVPDTQVKTHPVQELSAVSS